MHAEQATIVPLLAVERLAVCVSIWRPPCRGGKPIAGAGPQVCEAWLTSWTRGIRYLLALSWLCRFRVLGDTGVAVGAVPWSSSRVALDVRAVSWRGG